MKDSLCCVFCAFHRWLESGIRKKVLGMMLVLLVALLVVIKAIINGTDYDLSSGTHDLIILLVSIAAYSLLMNVKNFLNCDCDSN